MKENIKIKTACCVQKSLRKILYTIKKIYKTKDIRVKVIPTYALFGGGIVVGAVESRSNSPDSSFNQGRGIVSLGETLKSHSTSFHPGV